MAKEAGKAITLAPMKEIVVLDNKRSNFINIGMTKFPPPRIIKNSVMKMDSTIINKEGIEKLLTMLPSEEEVSKIEEAQVKTHLHKSTSINKHHSALLGVEPRASFGHSRAVPSNAQFDHWSRSSTPSLGVQDGL